jgi:hypothetical protein
LPEDHKQTREMTRKNVRSITTGFLCNQMQCRFDAA